MQSLKTSRCIKCLLILSFITFLPLVFWGQNDSSYRVRNIAWATPVGKSSTINGLAIGLMALPFGEKTTVKINGLNIEAAPLSAFFWAYAIVGTVRAGFGKPDAPGEPMSVLTNKNVYPDDSTVIQARIRGISISGGGLASATNMSGIAINALISFPDRMQGIEVTGFVNVHYEFNGLMIAGLRNKATRGRGIQIALFNSCQRGQLLQVGLLNRIGKRTLPFMNVSFKR